MDTHPSRDAKSPGHEPPEANAGAVWLTGAGLATVVVVSFVLVAGMMKFFAAVGYVQPGEPAIPQVPIAPGVPELNPNQPVALHDLRERERRVLDSYGWTDRAAGVARIPIERAMQIVIAEGLPETPPPTETSLKNSAKSEKP